MLNGIQKCKWTNSCGRWNEEKKKYTGTEELSERRQITDKDDDEDEEKETE